MSPVEFLCWQMCVGALDSFMEDKKVASLEITIPPLNKVDDPFLQIRKKMGPHDGSRRDETHHDHHRQWLERDSNPQEKSSLLEREGKRLEVLLCCCRIS